MSRVLAVVNSTVVVRAGRLVVSSFVVSFTVVCGVVLAWFLASGTAHAQESPPRNLVLVADSAALAPRQDDDGVPPDAAADPTSDAANQAFRQGERDYANDPQAQQAAAQLGQDAAAAQQQQDQQQQEQEQEQSDRTNEAFRQDERDYANDPQAQQEARQLGEDAAAEQRRQDQQQDQDEPEQEDPDQPDQDQPDQDQPEQDQQDPSDAANEAFRQGERDYANDPQAQQEARQLGEDAAAEQQRQDEQRQQQEQEQSDRVNEAYRQGERDYANDPQAQQEATRLGLTVAEEERRRDDRTVSALDVVPHPWESREEALADAERRKMPEPISQEPVPLTRSDPDTDDEVAAALADVRADPDAYGPAELAAVEKKLRDAARERARAAGFDDRSAEAAAYAAAAGFGYGLTDLDLPDVAALPGESRDFGYVTCEEGGTACAVGAPSGSVVPGVVQRADPGADPAAAVADEQTVQRRTARVPLGTDIEARSADEIAAETAAIAASVDERAQGPSAGEQLAGKIPFVDAIGAEQDRVDADADAQRAATNLLRAQNLLAAADTPEERAAAEQVVADARAQVIGTDQEYDQRDTAAENAALQGVIDVATRGRSAPVRAAGDLAGYALDGLPLGGQTPTPSAEEPSESTAADPAQPTTAEQEPGAPRGPPPALDAVEYVPATAQPTRLANDYEREIYAYDLRPQQKSTDRSAEALAVRINGEPQQEIVEGKIVRAEMDAVSDEWVGETKNKDYIARLDDLRTGDRDQVRKRFLIAQVRGLGVYYHNQHGISPGIREQLKRYSREYGVPVQIDGTPLDLDAPNAR